MSRRVLVLGARGFLGEHIVQQLEDSKQQVVAVVRPGSKHGFGPSVRIVEGDLLGDLGFLHRELHEVDAVIFSAGRTWIQGLPVGEYYRQNVEIAQRFFEALGDRPSLRVVFTSSIANVGGTRSPKVFREDSNREGVCEGRLSPYDRAKMACEAIAMAAARRGNNVVVLNPGLLLGRGATPVSQVAAPFQLLWSCQGKLPFYVNGGVTLSDVRDVARAHVAALDRGRSGERYFLGGHNIDRRDFYRRVARLTGLRPPHALPGGLVTAVMTFTDGLEYVTRGLIKSQVHRSFARIQDLYYYVSSEKAATELGYTITPLDDIILDLLRYYDELGLLSAEMAFVGKLTSANAPSFVLLRQLAAASGTRKFLLPRLDRLYAIVCSNLALSEAFDHLSEQSTFNDSTARYQWDRHACRDDLKTLNRFFEYVYFASNEFLGSVL